MACLTSVNLKVMDVCNSVWFALAVWPYVWVFLHSLLGSIQTVETSEKKRDSSWQSHPPDHHKEQTGVSSHNKNTWLSLYIIINKVTLSEMKPTCIISHSYCVVHLYNLSHLNVYWMTLFVAWFYFNKYDVKLQCIHSAFYLTAQLMYNVQIVLGPMSLWMVVGSTGQLPWYFAFMYISYANWNHRARHRHW